MIGNLVDSIRLWSHRAPRSAGDIKMLDTDYGRLRVLDTQGSKPVIMCVPDGPNVIEHYLELVARLSANFRVVCFEFPGLGFSFPSLSTDYSLDRSARTIIQVMDILRIDRAALSFSCSNGFYAMKAAELAPDRFTHLFLVQTPSLHAMHGWMGVNIPKVLTYPVIGQLTNAFTEKKLAKTWYKIALPKGADRSGYESKAEDAINQGGCFCLSALVQGLNRDIDKSLYLLSVPSTQVWGDKDFSHRMTDHHSILQHIPHCEIIRFAQCGHFPDLEDTDYYVKLINERLA